MEYGYLVGMPALLVEALFSQAFHPCLHCLPFLLHLIWALISPKLPKVTLAAYWLYLFGF